MTWIATSYKNRGASTCPCLLCQTLTKGRAQEFYLGYGVTIRLCERHASREFIEADGGRHFRLSVHLALRSAGRLTRRHVMAIDSFGARFSRPKTADGEPNGRPRPGSYAWAEVRKRLEERLAKGSLSIARMVELVRGWLKVELRRGLVAMPSLRTLRRWRFERRWATGTATPPPG